MNPFAVIVPRKEVIHDRHWTPAVSARFPIEVRAETAPSPVDYTAFAGVGRDPSHAYPHQWHYIHLAIQDKLSIAAPFFGVRKTPGAMVAPGSRVGGMNPVQERTNIIAPRPESLSSRAAVYAYPTYSPHLAKLV